ncbi:MAG: hypothetical protein Fur0037_20340 [Planctomycetota bacterium]
MGVVRLATQEGMNRLVAVKLLRPEFQPLPQSKERFRREIDAVSRLQHPGIVPVYQCGEENGILYLAMEHVRGRSLRDVLSSLRTLAAEQVTGLDLLHLLAEGPSSEPALQELCSGSWVEVCLRIARGVASALHHAHERGVIHRDVKPSNIVIGCDGRVMLMDFGMATAIGSHRLTRSGSQPGSLPYMAPERLTGRTSDRRTDVYGLAVTLYESLTFACPYWDANPEVLRRLLLEGKALPLRARNRQIWREVEIVCEKAMDPAPSRRYASAADFAADLSALLQRRPIAARPIGPVLRAVRWSQQRPAVAAALAASAAAAVLVPLLVNLSLRAQRDEALRQAYGARIVAAGYFLSVHNALAAKAQLRSCPEPLRGFEWNHLALCADQSEEHLPGLRGYFASIHWAARGRLLVHMDEGGGILEAVDPDRGTPIWKKAVGTPRWSDSSPDGSIIALADGTPRIRRYDAATGAALDSFRTSSGQAVFWHRFLPSGRLAVASNQGEVEVLDDHGAPLSSTQGMPSICRAVSPDGSLAVAGRWDQDQGGAELWDLTGGKRIFDLPALAHVWAAAFDDEGGTFALGTESSEILVLDRTGSLKAKMSAHARRSVNSIRFAKDGRLCSVGNDGTLQIWNAESGELLETRYGHDAIVLDLDLNPQDDRVATISPFVGTRIWRLDSAPHRRVLGVGPRGVEDLEWSREGRLIYAVCDDWLCIVLDASSGREVRRFAAGARLSQCASCAGRLATTSFDQDHALVLWDLASPENSARLPAAGYQDMPVAFSPASARVAFGDAEGFARFLDPDSPVEGGRVPTGGPPTALCFSADGKEVFSGTRGGEIRRIDIAKGRMESEAKVLGPVLAACWTGDSIWFGEGQEAVCRDPSTLAVRFESKGHQGWVHDLSATKDGRRIASASHDGSVRIWRTTDGECLAVLEGSGSYVYCLAFDPDSRRLAAGCGDGSIYVWSGSPR